MYKLTIDGDSDTIELVMFVVDIINEEDYVLDGAEDLSYLMDKILAYFGSTPLDIAVYSEQHLEKYLDAARKMRTFADALDGAIKIPKEKVREERARLRKDKGMIREK